jgi:hypothetical protein
MPSTYPAIASGYPWLRRSQPYPDNYPDIMSISHRCTNQRAPMPFASDHGTLTLAVAGRLGNTGDGRLLEARGRSPRVLFGRSTRIWRGRRRSL